MAIKKTIAIIEATGEREAFIAKRLSNAYRLLLIGAEKVELHQLAEGLKEANNNTEVEVIECAREACWEADIIITPYPLQKEVIQRIKEVSVGKVVVCISRSKDAGENLQHFLPYSRVAILTMAANQKLAYGNITCLVKTTDDEALETVAALLGAIGSSPVISEEADKQYTLQNMEG